jgi:Leucine-rich repeat (LRR) protein
MQCLCGGTIDFVSEETLDKDELFRAILGLSPTDTYSCEPDTLALMILAESASDTVIDTVISYDVLMMHYVLNVLYLSLVGNTWTRNHGWLDFNTTCPCCLYGVSCIDDHAVISIDLANNGLSGSIPTEIGLLTALTSLNMSENEIAGTFPTEIGRLTNLEVLWLDNNMLSSTLPSSLGTLPALKYLSMIGNRLSGSLPTELGILTKLESLGVTLNSNEANGPAPIWHISTLKYLTLRGCGLSGTIPWSQLRLMSTLASLQLVENQLTGGISSEIGLLTALQVLHLDFNQLTGTLPTEIGKCVALEKVVLSYNELSGTIPSDSLGKLVHLEFLDLSANKISGSVPVSTTGVCGLRTNGKLQLFSADCYSYVNCPLPECCSDCV